MVQVCIERTYVRHCPVPYGEFSLRTMDGLPFEPSTFVCAVPNMAVGDILTFSATRQARVVVRQDDCYRTGAPRARDLRRAGRRARRLASRYEDGSVETRPVGRHGCGTAISGRPTRALAALRRPLNHIKPLAHPQSRGALTAQPNAVKRRPPGFERAAPRRTPLAETHHKHNRAPRGAASR
jgi:hypothetical protein